MPNTAQPPQGGVARASIYDVAERAGVSHMTVSRVLNGHPNIRESTRDRVLQAIEELNYTRSSIARALATKRTMRIGALVDAPTQYGPNSTLRAIEDAARANGYSVSVFSIGSDEGQRIDSGVLDLVTQGVEALCVVAPRASTLERLRQQSIGIPTLIVAADSYDGLHAAVDQRAGAVALVQHLIGLGHREILHLAGPPDWFHASARAEAWREALETAGLAVREPVIGDWSSDSGYEFGRSYDFGDATAVFAANDQMALGVIHGLADRGLRVPDDMSVVGFDDLPDARHFLPPLTTVRQDFAALGSRVIDGLLAAIDGGPAGGNELIESTLIVRSSSGIPRSR